MSQHRTGCIKGLLNRDTTQEDRLIAMRRVFVCFEPQVSRSRSPFFARFFSSSFLCLYAANTNHLTVPVYTLAATPDQHGLKTDQQQQQCAACAVAWSSRVASHNKKNGWQRWWQGWARESDTPVCRGQRACTTAAGAARTSCRSTTGGCGSGSSSGSDNHTRCQPATAASS